MRLRYLLCALCAAFSFSASAAIPATEQTVAVEFYHAQLDHYFISANPKEINDIDTGVHKGWTRTGYRFSVIKSGSSYEGTSPVCRFYSPTLDTHFYSAKKSECDDVKTKPEFTKDWTFESDEVFRAFVVDPTSGTCGADTTATYRLWNNRADSNHRYTDQVGVFLYMKSTKSFVPEGDGNPALPIVFCTPSGGDVVPVANESAPNCTVTANSSTPAVGSTLNLDASCTNAPSTFLWQGCASDTNNCKATRTAAGPASYTLYAANAAGPSDPVTLTVNWGGGGGGGGGAVPICSLSSNTIGPTVGQTITFTASCNNSPSSYDWVVCDYMVQSICNPIPGCSSTAPTCNVSQTAPGYTRHGVGGKNSAGSGPRVHMDLYWTGTGGGGGGGGGGGAVPVCSAVTPSSTSPAVGTTLTLTATCSGNPTSYSWGGEGLAAGCGSSATCTATSSVAQPVTYYVSASNSYGTGGTAYSSGVTWVNPAPQVPVCSLSSSNASPQLGQTITVTASCTNSPTTFTWKAGCTSTTSSCTDAAAAAGAKVYTMAATNAAGNSADVSLTVNWQPPPTPQPPTCTLTSSSANPMVDTNITLTATCTNPPITTYTWIGCTSTTNTCTATSPVAGVATYGVKATNAVGEGAMATVPVTWQPRPTAPPACTVTSSNATPSANTNITLTATCTNSPTSYVWSNCTSTTNTCTATSASAGLVTYGVTATNVIGAGTPATVDVTWQAAPTSYCSAYSDVKYIDIPWGSSARYYTSSVGGFPQDRVIVVSITVPSTSGSYPIQGNTAFAEWQGPPAQRVMTLSTSACDFTPGSYMAGAGGTSPFIAWNVGVPPNSLVPGRTYYFNLKNQPGACPYSSCDMSTTIQWPH